MVVSEWIASTGGIGYFIVNAQESFDYLDMWTGIIVLALVGTILNLAFVLAENRLLYWHYEARATEGIL
jgi:ABC-type nitrate/sulfonate/bicarbonate transport system permease component